VILSSRRRSREQSSCTAESTIFLFPYASELVNDFSQPEGHRGPSARLLRYDVICPPARYTSLAVFTYGPTRMISPSADRQSRMAAAGCSRTGMVSKDFSLAIFIAALLG
jgi:hypothetical protein